MEDLPFLSPREVRLESLCGKKLNSGFDLKRTHDEYTEPFRST